MDERIIRKVSSNENERFNGDCATHFARTSRLTSTLNLFTRPHILNKAIRLWVSTHPILQAKIADVNGERHLVYDERFTPNNPENLAKWKEDKSDLENVKYLHLDSSKLTDDIDKSDFFDDLSWLLCEQELDKPLDIYKELLWRVIIVELDRNDAENEFEYILSLVLHHGVSGGRNIHMVHLHLLDMIEFCWFADEAALKTPLKIFNWSPSIDELYYDHFDSSNYSKERLEKLPGARKANYLNENEARECPIKPYAWAEKLSSEWIYKLERTEDQTGPSTKPFYKLADLIESSKTINCKTRRFTMNKEKSDKFIAKCKQEKCTVTGALMNMTAIALKKLSITNSQDLTQDEHAQINTFLVIALRQFEANVEGFIRTPEFIEELSLGFFIGITQLGLKSIIDLDSSMLGDMEKFWECCRIETKQMKKSIENKEMFFQPVHKVREPLECEATFFISSLGIIPHKLPDKFALSPRKCFKISKTYSEMSLNKKDFYDYGHIYLFATTCNGFLHMAFQYSSCVISHSKVDQFVENFLELFEKAIN